MAPAPADEILSRLKNVKKGGSGWTARCPSHEDKRNSLSIGVGDGDRVLLKCHAGCDTVSQIFPALGVAPSEPSADSRDTSSFNVVAEYDYRDEEGTLLYQNVRLHPKDFRVRRPDGVGGWIWKQGDVRRAPFRLPAVVEAAKAGATVYVVEGEKDVLALEELGLVATTSGNATSWRDEFADSLANANVVVLPDNDQAGRKYANNVATSCRKRGIPVKVVALPGLTEKGDVSDWVAGGGDRDKLEALVGTADAWVPTAITSTTDENVELGIVAQSILDAPHLTDAVLAEAILRANRDRMVLCEPFGWHFFSKEAGWEAGEEKRLLLLVREAVEDVFRLASQQEARREELLKAYLRWSNGSKQAAVMRLVAGYALDPALGITSNHEGWDADPDIIGTPDGILNLHTGHLTPYHPGHKVRLHAKGSIVESNPEADARWRSFLEEVMPDPEVREYVRWAMGRAVYGTGKDEALYLITGPGGTGKSTFLGGIQNALGSYAPTIKASILLSHDDSNGATPDLMRLFRARIAIIVETRQGVKFNEAALKQLTGGDRISARNLYQHPIEFAPSHSVFLATNSTPTAVVDDAIQRRLRVIPFDSKISDSQEARARKVWLQDSRDAASAVLRWLARAAKDYQNTLTFEIPAAIKSKTTDTLVEGDLFLQFLEDRTEKADDWVATADLLGAYDKWCEENRVSKSARLSSRSVSQRLNGLGFKAYRPPTRGAPRGRWGLQLVSNTERAPLAPAESLFSQKSLRERKTEDFPEKRLSGGATGAEPPVDTPEEGPEPLPGGVAPCSRHSVPAFGCSDCDRAFGIEADAGSAR